jgi:hypothetical protein
MNWVNLGFGLAICGTLLASLRGGLLDDISTTRAITQTEILSEANSQIAQKRYQNGCLLLSGGVYPKLTFPSVVEGGVIRNRETGQILPKGTVVCDSQGATGIINAHGAIASVAVTPNRDVVAKVMRRFKGGNYSQPIGGN